MSLSRKAFTVTHAFMMVFHIQVQANPIDYNPLLRCNGSYCTYLGNASEITHRLWLSQMRAPQSAQTPVRAFMCVHLSESHKWGCVHAHTHRNMHACKWSYHTHPLPNKLVRPLNSIFLDEGAEKQRGASLMLLTAQKSVMRRLIMLWLERLGVFVGQAVDTARLSHTSRWAQWTRSSAVLNSNDLMRN